MLSHIPIRQTDADGEEADYEHDTHYFSCKNVCNASPRTWIEYAEDVRSQKDAKARSKDDLIHIQLDTNFEKEEKHHGVYLISPSA